MSAVSNDQDILNASVEAKRLADEAIASHIKGKLEGNDSLDMEHLIGILHQAFDVDGGASISGKVDPSIIADLKEKFKDLIDKIKDRPDLYVPSLCVDGKISPDLAAKFCAGQVEMIKAEFGGVAVAPKSTTVTTTTTTTTAASTTTGSPTEVTSTTSSTKDYSSYMNMAQVVADVSYDLSYIESKVTEDSALQTKWLAEENEALIASAQTELDDVNKQISDIAAQKRHARHMRRTMGALTHILGSVAVVLSVMSCNPVLIAIAVTAFADQETALNTGKAGFIEQGTNAFADVLILSASGYGIKLSPEAAKIIAAVVVTVVIAAAVGFGSESLETGILVGAFMAQSSGLFSDIAEAQIAAQHADTHDADNIRMEWMITGAAICLFASIGAAFSMGAAETAEESEATVLSQITAQLQQMTREFLEQYAKISANLADKLMIGALAVGTGTEVSITVTNAVMSGILAANVLETAKQEKELDYSQADLSLKTMVTDQLETVAETQAGIAQKEVSSLGESTMSSIFKIDQAALGSVIQV